MQKTGTILIALLMLGVCVHAQTTKSDSALFKAFKEEIAKDTSFKFLEDTTIDYDALFQDFDAFMDSILNPGSYFLASINAGKGYFNSVKKGTIGEIETAKRMTWSPALGYFHKSGAGISLTGYLTNDGQNLNLYQSAITPSFDYLKNRDLATGFSYSRYITKDSLSFYTTPIQNEFYAYFTWRKWWVRPTVFLSYGWGSRTDYTQREEIIQDLRLRRRGFTYINTKESVKDFSITASARHDFYWLDVLKYNDHIRFTPQLSLTSGTQKFGFNMTYNAYTTLATTNASASVLYFSDDFTLDDQLNFQPLSFTLYLKGEYSIGKFFIQPQLAFDYYLPDGSQKLNTFFTVNAGLIF